jgi:hypothetical protein
LTAVDRHGRSAKWRTDLGDLAELSAVEALTALCAESIPGLLRSVGAVQNGRAALTKLATASGFGKLSRDFFSRLTRRYIDVGINARFHSLKEHAEFERAIDAHCEEASVIIEEFSREWYSKHTHLGGITERKAGSFVYVAFEKIQKELRRRRDADH